MFLLDYDMWDESVFEDNNASILASDYLELTGAILDEVSLRQETSNTSSTKDTWQFDSLLLAKFLNTLEAGNVTNEGVKITKFKIMRSKVDGTESFYMGEVENNSSELEFIDGTQPNTDLIYTIIPVGENDLDGVPKEILVSSEFTGWWIVDKDSKEAIPFDKALGSMGSVDITLNQSRVQIDTFAKYPHVYYMNQEYSSFTLSSVFLPEEWERSGETYLRIINTFILQRKPFLVKSSNGLIYIVNLFNPRVTVPQNTWTGHDYITSSLDAVEIGQYKDYMSGDL